MNSYIMLLGYFSCLFITFDNVFASADQSYGKKDTSSVHAKFSHEYLDPLPIDTIFSFGSFDDLYDMDTTNFVSPVMSPLLKSPDATSFINQFVSPAKKLSGHDFTFPSPVITTPL